MNKQDTKEMLQIELNKKREFWEVSNIGSDNFCAVFTQEFGKLRKVWEGNWETCLRYIEGL